MRARRLTVLATSLTAATALALTGCSDSGSTDDAATKPGASTGASTSGTQAGASELTADTFIKTVADAQSSAKSYTFSMVSSAGGEDVSKATGAVLTNDGKPAVAMSMDVSGMSIETRFVDGVWYMNFGDQTGGKFVKIDPSADDSAMAAQLEAMTDQMNPTESVKALDGAVTSVTKAGEPVTLDGVEAQPYKVVVDTSKIGGAMGDTIAAAGDALPTELTYTYWLGSDNLMRKMTFDLAGATTEMTMSDWTTDVDVKAPSADEITDKSPFDTAG